MFERFQALLLRLLRVPPEPDPPFGKPSSVRVFPASRKLFLLRLVRWGFVQAIALAGILFWVAVVAVSEHEVNRMRAQGPEAGAFSRLAPGRNKMVLTPLRHVPPALFTLLWLVKTLGLFIYLAQLTITYAALRLDYQMRWYIVTDRSLRIRWGLWNVQEVTMSYANLQQVVVSQGPLERLLGISDVRVESAGGGGKSASAGEGKADTMHSGVFHGVENATDIRDLILERLRSFRDSGLGDPDESTAGEPRTSSPCRSAAIQDVLDAGGQLLSEACSLRAAVKGKI